MPQNPFVDLIGKADWSKLGNPINMGSLIAPQPQMQAPPINRPMQQPQMNPYEFYQPQMGMQNRFAELLGQMPNESKPSFLRKLGSSLGAMNSQNPFQAAQLSAHAPYINQMQQWQMRMPFAQQAADNERQANQVGMNANNQFRQREFELRKQDEVERNNQANNKVKEADQARKDRLAELEVYKAQHPLMKWQVVDGTLYAINPLDGKLVDTGIKGMSKMEELKFQAQAAMDRTIQQGQNQQQNTQLQGQNQIANTTLQGQNQLANTAAVGQNQLGAIQQRAITLPAPRANAAQRPLAERVQAFKLANPELGKFITIDTNAQGGIKIVTPGSTWFDKNAPTQVQYDQIIKALGLDSTISGLPNNAAPKQPTPTTGTVNVISPNGTPGTIPASQLNDALSQGYKRAQ